MLPPASGGVLETPTDRTPGSTRELAHDPALQRGLLRVGRILRGGRRDRQRRQMVGLQADVDVQQTIQALPEQRRAHEQNHRGRQLEDHQLGADASPGITGRCRGCPRVNLARLTRRATGAASA